jgi:hypothetical protein
MMIRLAALIVVAASLNACGQQNPTLPAATSLALSGTVFGGGFGVPGVPLTIMDGINAGKTTTSDSGGKYGFANLTPSAFTLRAAATGGYGAQNKAVDLTTFDRSVNFDLPDHWDVDAGHSFLASTARVWNAEREYHSCPRSVNRAFQPAPYSSPGFGCRDGGRWSANDRGSDSLPTHSPFFVSGFECGASGWRLGVVRVDARVLMYRCHICRVHRDEHLIIVAGRSSHSAFTSSRLET